MKTLLEVIKLNKSNINDVKIGEYSYENDIEAIKWYLYHINMRFKLLPIDNLKVEYGLDDEGYYFDTVKYGKGPLYIGRVGDLDIKDFKVFCDKEFIDQYNETNKNKQNFKKLPYIRWRKHIGEGTCLTICIVGDMQNFNSIEGLPDNITTLVISEGTGIQSKSIDFGNHHIDKLLVLHPWYKLDGNPTVKEIVWSGQKPKVNFNCQNIRKI